MTLSCCKLLGSRFAKNERVLWWLKALGCLGKDTDMVGQVLLVS